MRGIAAAVDLQSKMTPVTVPRSHVKPKSEASPMAVASIVCTCVQTGFVRMVYGSVPLRAVSVDDT
jgi:hypothetical protein